MKGIKVGGTGLNNLCYDDDATPTTDTVHCRAQDINPLKPNSNYYTLSYSPNLAILVSLGTLALSPERQHSGA